VRRTTKENSTGLAAPPLSGCNEPEPSNRPAIFVIRVSKIQGRQGTAECDSKPARPATLGRWESRSAAGEGSAGEATAVQDGQPGGRYASAGLSCTPRRPGHR